MEDFCGIRKNDVSGTGYARKRDGTDKPWGQGCVSSFGRAGTENFTRFAMKKQPKFCLKNIARTKKMNTGWK